MTEEEIWNTYYNRLSAELHLITGELMRANQDDKAKVVFIARTHGYYLPYLTGRPENFASFGGTKPVLTES